MSAPFAWQDKRMLRRIREQIEDYGSAVAVYLALTVAASDKAVEEFQTTHAWLASASGFGERTVRHRLADLVRIGAVHVTTPALRGPCTYRLLTFGNDSRTNGNQCRTFGNLTRQPLPRSEITINRREPLSPSERVSADKQLTALRQKHTRLKEDTAEAWQRRAYPERLEELQAVGSQIADIESRVQL